MDMIRTAVHDTPPRRQPSIFFLFLLFALLTLCFTSVTAATAQAATWTAVAVGAGPSGTGTILWDRSDGAAGLWVLGANGAETAIGPIYGPYTGWTAKAVATANDGTSRVLWTNANGEAGVWTFDATGNETIIGPAYGPYAVSKTQTWKAQGVGVAGDGTARVLWTLPSGIAGLWTLDATNTVTTFGTTYFLESGWGATALATAQDGTSSVLWNNTEGAASVWLLGANDLESVIGSNYGPYAGWTAKAVGMFGDVAADDAPRVLWTNVGGGMRVWSFDTSANMTAVSTLYGPYSGWSAGALATGNDGTSRVLWNNVSRAAGVWSFDTTDTQSVVGPTYGPY